MRLFDLQKTFLAGEKKDWEEADTARSGKKEEAIEGRKRREGAHSLIGRGDSWRLHELKKRERRLAQERGLSEKKKRSVQLRKLDGFKSEICSSAERRNKAAARTLLEKEGAMVTHVNRLRSRSRIGERGSEKNDEHGWAQEKKKETLFGEERARTRTIEHMFGVKESEGRRGVEAVRSKSTPWNGDRAKEEKKKKKDRFCYGRGRKKGPYSHDA